MSLYQLNKPLNQKTVEQRFIRERIDLLSERQWQLTGDDYRRCKISIDYNRRLLDDPTATVTYLLFN
uniref:hypothetical protein n=1 Tax=Endozoicomonas sp. ONNA2 TaxID=2828741 RepID=UPI0021496F03